MIMLAPDTAAVATLCLPPAAVCLLYVCLYNEPILEWAGQKTPMFHVIDTLKLEVSKLLWISIPRL